MTATLTIGGRTIGSGHPPYVVAEMSSNHNGRLDRAMQLLEAAKAAGADALKLQTYRADTITIDHDGPGFRLESGLWAGRRLYELYEEAHTPWDWHAPLFARGREIGITVFSAPFDPTAVALLETLDSPAYKIASPEIIDLPLIELVAATGKPLIISTGMASWAEIEEAVATARDAGCSQLAVLHCVSGYPLPPEEANLATIPDLAARLGVVIGLSDHSLGTQVATVAVGLGAKIIEKHFTLARADGGVDSNFSLEPAELARLVTDVGIADAARGVPNYQVTASEQAVLSARRSLYVVSDIAKGEPLTGDNIRSIRPNRGLAPKYQKDVLGRTASRDLQRGEPLDWDMITADQPATTGGQ